jgi:predicted MFS family arabinose efflux permease
MHFSTLRTGLTRAAAGVAGLAAGITSGMFAQRFGTKRALIGGAMIQALATAALCTLPQERTQLLVAALMVVVNFSGVVALVMVNITTMADVAPSEQGLAGGLLLTCEQLGGALGLAVIAAVANSRAAEGAATPGLDGYRWGIAVAALLTFGGALVGLFGLSRRL